MNQVCLIRETKKMCSVGGSSGAGLKNTVLEDTLGNKMHTLPCWRNECLISCH